MPKYRIFLFLVLISACFFAQTKEAESEDYVNDNVLRYDDYTYKPNIKTVKLHERTWEFAAPIISLHRSEQLELSFDDLDGDKKVYSVTFIHCNHDWTPSDLMVSEFLKGFYELNFLEFGFAQSTAQKYTHYSIVFPEINTQQNTHFTKSGNYILYVYENGDPNNIVLSRRFSVYDDKVAITAQFSQAIGDGQLFLKQHMDFTIVSGGYEITNPYKDMNVTILQNNRWDNAVTDIKPSFMNGTKFDYNLIDASTFNGGNEFRYFDLRSVRFLTERVSNIYRDENYKVHAVIQHEDIRANKPYLFRQDFNGNFLIRNTELAGNMDEIADYAFVEFFLPYPNPETNGNFYIMGKLTDWRMNKKSQMTYNYKRMGYEATLLLKQGYYNYIIVLSDDKKKGGDETVMEGNHWDTENDYYILVYHRKFGTAYDQLIGFKKFNSHHK